MKLDVMTASLTAALMLAACGGNTDGDTHADRDVAGVDSYGVDTADLDSAGGPDQGSTGRDTHYWQDTAGADAPVDAVVPDDAIDAGREFGIDVINIGYDPEFSECGGFAPEDGTLQQARDPFCGQSLMKWAVDPVTGEIRLTFENIFFNCCGEHEIAVENDDGVIVVTIIDRPTDGGDRCSCTCGYDYAVTMPPLKDAVQACFQLYHVIDGEYYPPESEGYAGHFWVDLTTGSGEVFIDGTQRTCQEFLYQATNVRISDCGGFEPNPEHCRPETFEWSYDPETLYLHVVNRNVIMDCCGERHAYAFRDPWYGIHIAELDVPPDSGRCDCRCMIDYSMDLYTYDVSYSAEYAITRTVTDAAVPDQVVWNDSIDETVPGVVVIREAADNCI